MRKEPLKTLCKAFLIMMVFFLGTCGLIAVDTICEETTGVGGKFVLDVDNWEVFN